MPVRKMENILYVYNLCSCLLFSDTIKTLNCRGNKLHKSHYLKLHTYLTGAADGDICSHGDVLYGNVTELFQGALKPN